MSVRRSPLVLTLLTVALTGCEKPPPYASVFAAGHTESGEATSWCFGQGSAAAVPLPDGCVQGPTLTGVLEVAAGDRVAIDVPTSTAKDGWTAALLTDADGGNATRVPGIGEDESYVRFTVPNVDADAYVLEVIALRPGGKPDNPRGVWRFRLDVKDAG